MSSVFDRPDADMPAQPAMAIFTHDTGDLVANAGQGLTKRQYAAIHLRVPDSGDAWLDQMIHQARAIDAAHHTLGGLILGRRECVSVFASEAVAVAQALHPEVLQPKEPTPNERT